MKNICLSFGNKIEADPIKCVFVVCYLSLTYTVMIMTPWHGNAFRMNSLLWGNPPVTGQLLHKEPAMPSFEVSFAVSQNKVQANSRDAGKSLALATNKYYDFNTTLMCSCINEKCNLQCPKLNMQNRMYRSVSFFNTSLKIPHDFQGIHHCIVNLWNIVRAFNNGLLASHKICYRLPYNNLSDKTKWQKGVAQAAAFCHFVP